MPAQATCADISDSPTSVCCIIPIGPQSRSLQPPHRVEVHSAPARLRSQAPDPHGQLLADASTRMLSGAHMPHVQILVLLSASLTIRWPKVQSKGSSNGGMGYSEGSTRLWEPRKGTDPALAVREGFLGRVFRGTFQWSL